MPSGACIIEKRMIDVALRIGLPDFTLIKWRGFLSQKMPCNAFHAFRYLYNMFVIIIEAHYPLSPAYLKGTMWDYKERNRMGAVKMEYIAYSFLYVVTI